MKEKKAFSKIDYYFMFIENFKDQLTIILVFNLVLFLIINQFNSYYGEVFFFANFEDVFHVLSQQFVLTDFFEYLSFIFLGSFIIHLMTYKLNKIEIFRINVVLLIISTTYLWSILSFDNILLTLEKHNLFFIFSIVGQLGLYVIAGNEFFQLFKKTIKQSKINHS